MQIIILGDTHLGRSLSIGRTGIGSTLNSRISDQFNLLDWTLDTALENHIEHIVITGDIFEEPKPTPQIMALFISWLKKCQVNDVSVYLIMGNHDLYRSGASFLSCLDIISEIDLDNVHVVKNINTFFINSTAFTLMPFRDRKSFNTDSNASALSILKDSLVYELSSIPSTYNKVLIGHFAIEGSIPVGDEIDDVSNELFCPISMFNGYDYVWMGHVHKPQVMKRKPYVAHIGSMDVSNFGETDHKKIIIIYDCNSNTFVEKLLPTRPLKKISIVIPKDTLDSTQYVLDSLKDEDLTKSIIKLDVSLEDVESQSINKSNIEKFLLEKGAFNIAGISEAKKINLVKKDSTNILTTKMDVLSAIKSYARTYIDEEFKEDFIELSTEIFNEYKLEAKE